MMEHLTDTHVTRRIGAVCAIVGSVVSVAAGTGFGNRTTTWDTERLLRYLASLPSWRWPLVYLGFILGAILWVGAFVVIADTLPGGTSRMLGRFAVASVIIGATIHVIDASVNGVGLAALARSWASASVAEQPNLLRAGDVLIHVVHGTWASVIALFHGLPFVLLGAAVLVSRRYPAWVGWFGIVGGAGSLILGVAMFLGTEVMLYVAFAIIVSLWMVTMGFLLWQGDVIPEHAPEGQGVATSRR
jgi:hypothetical protein